MVQENVPYTSESASKDVGGMYCISTNSCYASRLGSSIGLYSLIAIAGGSLNILSLVDYLICDHGSIVSTSRI